MTTLAGAAQAARELGAGFVEYKFRDDDDVMTTYVVVAVDEDARELAEVVGEWAERREAEMEERA